jgi:diguanylate cyclase (GGDEF)-like protein
MSAQQQDEPVGPSEAVGSAGTDEARGALSHPPMPADEDRRLRTLEGYGVVDSERDARFEDLVAQVAQECSVPIATITFVDATRQWFKASVGLEVAETSRDVALCAYTILDADGPMVIPDTTRDPRFRDNPLVVGDPGLMAYAGAPIVAPDGTVMGTVCAMDLEPHDYSAHEIATLSRVSRRVVELLEDARVAEELALGGNVEPADERVTNAPDASLALTRPLIEAIGEDIDVVELIESFCGSVLQTFGWWAARVAWVQGDNLQPGAWQVAPGGPAAFAPLTARGAAPTILDDLAVSFPEATLLDVSMLRWISDRDILTSLGARHAVVIDVPGVTTLAARLVFLVPTARALDPEAHRSLTTAAAVLPRVIVQQRARQELTYRATHDSLTGLLNREGLQRVHRTTDADAVHARRALLYLDIDDFKHVNDTHGHRAGDEMLIRLARLLGSHLRPTDTVTRLGGDEFVIVLEGIEEDDEVARVARRLLGALCGPITLLRTMHVEASVSIGAVRWTGGPLESALERADRLMYSAKELGGSRAAVDGGSGRHVFGADESDAKDLDAALDGAVDVRTGTVVGLDPQGRATVRGVRAIVSSTLRHPDVNDLAHAVKESLGASASTPGAQVLRLELTRELWAADGLAVRLLVALRERLPGVMLEVAIGPDAVASTRGVEAAIAVRDGLGLPLVLTGFGSGRGELSLVDRLRPMVLELDPDVVGEVLIGVQSTGSERGVTLPGALVAARALSAERGMALCAASDMRMVDQSRPDELLVLLAPLGVTTVAVVPAPRAHPTGSRAADVPAVPAAPEVPQEIRS